MVSSRGYDDSFHGLQQTHDQWSSREGAGRQRRIGPTRSNPPAHRNKPRRNILRGSKPIGGPWISSDLNISNACVMPFRYIIGNHHAFILDISIESLMGINPIKIV
jgi:hypothetical protein